nr:fibronectin type III-like domain-contianing protein [Lachnoclostridium sp. Marseille-P6806]
MADILSGAAVPSGKLTDSWAFRYTEFSIRFAGITHYELGTEMPSAGVRLTVTNIGVMSGREVAQLYVSCPQTGEGRELRRLVGFAKTKELEPEETEDVEIRFPLYALAAFDEALPGWTLPRGEYVMMVGNSFASAETVGVIHALEDGYPQRENSDGTGDGPDRKGDRELRYQYTTAFPVGTALAQSWDLGLLRRVGAAVGEELVEFGITLWLAYSSQSVLRAQF